MSNMFSEYKVDYRRIMSRRFQDPDFAEGVRAALLDKDSNPQWCPKYLSEVGCIEKYFLPQTDELELK